MTIGLHWPHESWPTSRPRLGFIGRIRRGRGGPSSIKMLFVAACLVAVGDAVVSGGWWAVLGWTVVGIAVLALSWCGCSHHPRALSTTAASARTSLRIRSLVRGSATGCTTPTVASFMELSRRPDAAGVCCADGVSAREVAGAGPAARVGQVRARRLRGRLHRRHRRGTSGILPVAASTRIGSLLPRCRRSSSA